MPPLRYRGTQSHVAHTNEYPCATETQLSTVLEASSEDIQSLLRYLFLTIHASTQR